METLLTQIFKIDYLIVFSFSMFCFMVHINVKLFFAQTKIFCSPVKANN